MLNRKTLPQRAYRLQLGSHIKYGTAGGRGLGVRLVLFVFILNRKAIVVQMHF